jgi:hypothetical protein
MLNSKEVCRRTGHPSQLYGLRRVRVDEGRASGTSIIEAATAEGLTADILPDTGMDIGQVRYKGTNKRTTTSRTEFARAGLDFFNTFCEPVDGEEERVFFTVRCVSLTDFQVSRQNWSWCSRRYNHLKRKRRNAYGNTKAARQNRPVESMD